jgi:hypothetical protein
MIKNNFLSKLAKSRLKSALIKRITHKKELQ